MASAALSASLCITLALCLLLADATAGKQMNVIDRCWRRNRRWASNRQELALCSVGFAGKMGRNRGRGLTHYVVTNSGDDPVKPQPGTLRYGATVLKGKVWITFSGDMQIVLKNSLVVKSFTAIDGRGADVHIAYGAGFLLQKVESVIIHGLHFHHLRAQPAGPVMDPEGRLTRMEGEDGDAIRLVEASKVWIDHNTLYACEDGLLDVTRGSTGITISNNWFRDHDKVMLLGHDDDYLHDKAMRVTVAFNRFGPNCNQRMPRIRHGYAHLVNNFYDGWNDYAVGGSANPSIRSEGNLFVPSGAGNKEVTMRIDDRGEGGSWNWRSVNDAFTDGAFFQQTGSGAANPRYNVRQRFPASSAGEVRSLTEDAGALRCNIRTRC